MPTGCFSVSNTLPVCSHDTLNLEKLHPLRPVYGQITTTKHNKQYRLGSVTAHRTVLLTLTATAGRLGAATCGSVELHVTKYRHSDTRQCPVPLRNQWLSGCCTDEGMTVNRLPFTRVPLADPIHAGGRRAFMSIMQLLGASPRHSPVAAISIPRYRVWFICLKENCRI